MVLLLPLPAVGGGGNPSGTTTGINNSFNVTIMQ
jgi:hypothetical protein